LQRTFGQIEGKREDVLIGCILQLWLLSFYKNSDDAIVASRMSLGSPAGQGQHTVFPASTHQGVGSRQRMSLHMGVHAQVPRHAMTKPTTSPLGPDGLPESLLKFQIRPMFGRMKY